MKIIKKSLFILLIFICLFLISLCSWLSDNFANLTIETLVFNLNMPLKGTPNALIISFYIHVIAIPIIISLGILVLQINWVNKKIISEIKKLKLLLLRIFPLPFLKRTDVLSTLMFLMACAYMYFKLDYNNVIAYALSKTSYIAPKSTLITFLVTLITILLGVLIWQIKWVNKKIPLISILIRVDILAALMLLITCTYIYFKMDYHNIIDYAFSKTSLYDNYYIEPKSTLITFPEKKYNLILIYLESMETTFQSKDVGGAFDINLIPELTKLASENINFSDTMKIGGTIQVFGTEWTMGGTVASSSGIPLKIPIYRNDMAKYSSFLPGSTTIGDILKNQGYYQVLMTGNDKEFAGVDLYYQTHGSYKIMDKIYFQEKGLIPEDKETLPKSSWGFDDIKLYKFAKKELTELSHKNTPFNFTMFTIDTHFPCDLDTTIPSASKQLYEFVRWVQSQSFYKSTTIVILGDHLMATSNDFLKIDSSVMSNL